MDSRLKGIFTRDAFLIHFVYDPEPTDATHKLNHQ